MKSIVAGAGILILTSCGGEGKQPPGPETKYHQNLEMADWLLGEWGNRSTQGELTERWRKDNDSIFRGESYFVLNDMDTVFAETVVLGETNGQLAYTVTVSDQNNAKPVRFEMTSISDKQIIFENPKHDFPSKIIYSRVGNDSLKAEISGTKDGKPASEQFAMKRYK